MHQETTLATDVRQIEKCWVVRVVAQMKAIVAVQVSL